MIDISSEVFNLVATMLRTEFEGIQVVGENTALPSKFPCVTIEETNNIPIERDSARTVKFAELQYTVQIFSNKSVGKRIEARSIHEKINDLLIETGMKQVTYYVKSDMYQDDIYQITTNYTCIVDNEQRIRGGR